jgi:hypothetical protein
VLAHVTVNEVNSKEMWRKLKTKNLNAKNFQKGKIKTLTSMIGQLTGEKL